MKELGQTSTSWTEEQRRTRNAMLHYCCSYSMRTSDKCLNQNNWRLQRLLQNIPGLTDFVCVCIIAWITLASKDFLRLTLLKSKPSPFPKVPMLH